MLACLNMSRSFKSSYILCDIATSIDLFIYNLLALYNHLNPNQ